MYNMTFPVCPRTGRERTVEQLTQLDPRIQSYIKVEQLTQPDPRIPPDIHLTAEDVQSCFLNAEIELSAQVPPEVRQRLVIARELGTYGYFQWEFFTVSLFWSLTAIEMSLRHKFHQVNPPPYMLCNKKKKKTRSENKALWMLEPLLQQGGEYRG